MAINVTIGGDFCVLPPYTSGNLFSDEIEILFKKSDLNIVNLECPVGEFNNNSKIIKTGPHLSTSTDIFKHLKQLNVRAVTLANNHIYDYGEKGVATTIDHCREENIAITGAGKNIAEATQPAILEVKGIKIALINFCENEWSIATDKQGGANPLNIIDNLNQIRKARESADFVLVLTHGGHELYNLPSPRMVKECRFFADNGADAVIGHHTHCISGYEVHNKVPVIYSLGNMLFTKNPPFKGWNTGLLVNLKLEKNKPVQFELHPIRQSTDNFNLNLLKENSKKEVIDEIEQYSRIIRNEDELQMNWEAFIRSKSQTLNIFSPLAVLPWKFPKALDRLGFNHFLLKRNNLARILNQIRCEAHRDLTISLLHDKIKK